MAGQSSWLLDSLQKSGKHGPVQLHYPIPPFELAAEQEGHWEQKRGRQECGTPKDCQKVLLGSEEDYLKVASGPGRSHQRVASGSGLGPELSTTQKPPAPPCEELTPR